MINWKLRLKNKATLASIIVLVISFVYKVLNLLGVVPGIEEQELIDIGMMVIDVLCFIGVVVDPTTAGISDSSRAMGYVEPNNDKIRNEEE